MIFTRTGLTQEIIQQYGAYSYMQKQKAEENPPCNDPDSFFLFVAQRGEGLCKEKETHLSAFYPVDADRRPIFFYFSYTSDFLARRAERAGESGFHSNPLGLGPEKWRNASHIGAR